MVHERDGVEETAKLFKVTVTICLATSFPGLFAFLIFHPDIKSKKTLGTRLYKNFREHVYNCRHGYSCMSILSCVGY